MERFGFSQKPIANSEKRRSLFFRLISYPLILIPLFVLPAFSQQTWTRTYGGTVWDQGTSVQQTSDGGYIIAGTTHSFGAGGSHVYLIKTNPSGDTLWTRTYGGPNDNWGSCVRQTTDGGYIIVGETYTPANKNDVYLVKTNASGDTLWTRTYGGANNDFGNSVRQTSDGGYIIAGTTYSFDAGNSKLYLIKTNASGDTLWTRTFGGSRDEGGNSVWQTYDGGYIVAGQTFSYGFGNGDVYLVKTNSSGASTWFSAIGGTSEDAGFSVQQTPDIGYIVVGRTNSFGAGGWDVYLAKTNSQGSPTWTKTYGGTGDDWGSSVQLTSDGGYIVAGRTNSFGAGGYDVYLIKTNAQGDTLWTRTFGGAGDDWANSVQQTSDGGYIIAGTTYSFGVGICNVYLIKTDSLGRTTGVEDNSPFPHTPYASRLTVSPNPFTSFATIPGHSSERFALYDISGRKVGTYQGDRIGKGLSAGVYFLRPEGREAKPLRVIKLR
jgi:hypothetical protein